MVIVMDMESGRRLSAPAALEEVKPTGHEVTLVWGGDLPREMPRLAEVMVERRAYDHHTDPQSV